MLSSANLPRPGSFVLTVVLSDSTGSTNVILNPIETAQTNIVQIHNRATRLDQVPSGIRTSRQSVPQELLVFGDEVLQLTFLGRQCIELADVKFAETFDVDGTAVLERRSQCWSRCVGPRRRTLSILW
jgi:ACT domain-containing protein